MGGAYKFGMMRLFFLAMFMIGVSTTATSQIDFQDNTTPPDGFELPAEIEGNESKSSSYPMQIHSLTDPEYRNGFSNPTDFLKKKEETLTMSTDNGLKQRIIEFKPDYLQNKKDSGGKGNQTTQYLGRFETNGKFVEIYCRDHEYVDGDKVQVLINGEIVVQSITLHGNFQPVLVSLKKGFNRIEIKALNEGTSSPNTAEFIVYGQNGEVITQNRWNLATGVKASFLINKL